MSESFPSLGSFERIHPGPFVRKTFAVLHGYMGGVLALVAIKSAAGRMGREVADIGLREAELFVSTLISSSRDFGLTDEAAQHLNTLLAEELGAEDNG